MGIAGVRISTDGDGQSLEAWGEWSLATAQQLYTEISGFSLEKKANIKIYLSELNNLDTAGAWLLTSLKGRLQKEGHQVVFCGGSKNHQILLNEIKDLDDVSCSLKRSNPLKKAIASIGETTSKYLEKVKEYTSFVGYTVVLLCRIPVGLVKIRGASLFYHLEHVGLRSIPIVSLISFLVGVVLAYQGADQLKRFGAEIYTVNLVGVAAFREVGILLAAIIIAGRSGSAFTAQIGTMQVNEEIDAMKTIGLDPVEILVLPRVVSLIICLPLLTFFANAAALFGGALVCDLALDISYGNFISQVRSGVSINALWVGLSKAPIFGFIIATIGCYEGLKVKGSAESVGRKTTESVVEGIFAVIVFDALFSIFFSRLGI